MGFYVINNGCDIHMKEKSNDIRKLYDIYPNEFLFIFVGNVGIRKNQKQVVDAFSILGSEERKSIKILFIGGGDYIDLEGYIKDKGVDFNLKVVGPVDKEDVSNYYIAADATILTSVSEGFGLSIIEGYTYGKPSLIFDDLPAYKELFISDAMLGCPSRETEVLAKAMLQMSSQKWNEQKIREWAGNFSLEEMARKYEKLYSEVIEK